MKPSTRSHRTIAERWTALRNAILADARFQRLSLRFPPTRPIARRHARRLFDLVAGFTYSQTLLAFVQLGLTDLLADAPLTAAEIAARAGLPEDGADRLLRAAAALGLAQRIGGGRYMLGVVGAALRGNPGVTSMVVHHPMLYADLADPVALLRAPRGGGALAGFWTYAGAAPGIAPAGDAAAYSALMSASQAIVAEQIVAAYPFRRHRRLLDVGGGEGRFAASVTRAAPGLAVGLFDLPAVAAQGRARPAGVTLHEGDFHVDPLPVGYDVITLVRVLHDHDDAPALALLRACRRALPPGGKLLIAEPMAEIAGAEPAGDAYFGLYLWAMGSGRPRSPATIRQMLAEAGFGGSRRIATALPLTVCAVVASI